MLADGDVAVRGEEELEQVLLRESEESERRCGGSIVSPGLPGECGIL